MYGLDHTLGRFDSVDALMALHPQSTVRGLYLTGQDTVNVGVTSALMSGLLTAARVSSLAAIRCGLDFLAA